MPPVKLPKTQSPTSQFYAPGDPVPALTRIPRPPLSFKPSVANLRGVKPRRSEINCVAQAVEELRGFGDYAQVFGTTAPKHDELLATLGDAAQWSAMRVTLAAWDRYCAHMEKMAWKASRAHLARLRPAFELANDANPSLAARRPNLAMLVRAMGAIVRKGVATKKANREAVSQGREPLRGKALRAARRAAEKAALALAEAEAKKKGSAKRG